MVKIFSKKEAMELKYGDVFCLWRCLDTNSPEHFNLIAYKVYSTRIDVFGASKKNLGLRWDKYGISWIISTPNNSYQKNNVTLEQVLQIIIG